MRYRSQKEGATGTTYFVVVIVVVVVVVGGGGGGVVVVRSSSATVAEIKLLQMQRSPPVRPQRRPTFGSNLSGRAAWGGRNTKA